MNLRKKTLLLPLLYLISWVLPGCPLHAQTTPAGYQAKWNIVDSLYQKKGLPQSALVAVTRIYALAKQEGNDAQTIRALTYRLRLQTFSYDDSDVSSIKELEKEIVSTRQPARQILQSILADFYWNFLQQNRRKFYDRTNITTVAGTNAVTDTTPVADNDPNYWTAADFQKKITDLYLSSLRDEKLLQSTSCTGYDPIMELGNTRHLRPTLFDLLAHQALGYFKNSEQSIYLPAVLFAIDDPAVFADAETFASYPFRTQDSLSLHYTALQLFQRLIRMHLTDPSPDALLDVDIERLNFVHNYSIMDNMEELYTSALTRLTDRWGTNSSAAQAWYLLARQHADKAQKYQPGVDTSGRYEYVPARAICERVIAEKDNSEGKTNCINLLDNILHKKLFLRMEDVDLPKKPMRTLVTWSNISTLYCRIIRLNFKSLQDRGSSYKKSYWQQLLRQPVLRSFSQPLPATGDYCEHNVEIMVDPLPVGDYALIAAADSSFILSTSSRHPMTVEYFSVSAIAVINNRHDYFVLDRDGGHPLTNARVQTWDIHYDYNDGRTITSRSRGEKYHTDNNGHFLYRGRSSSDQTVDLEITTPNDHLYSKNAGWRNYFDIGPTKYLPDQKKKYEADHQWTYLFLDRSIYRPGQTVYFKGIIVTRDFDTKRAKSLSRLRTMVSLFDSNNQPVDSLEVVTDDFGSYNGHFRIPQNRLNGEFSIRDSSTYGSQVFSVEEYKRPGFYLP
jgi:hypothetical protein